MAPRHQLSSQRRRVDSRHIQSTRHPPPTPRPSRSTKRHRFSIDSRCRTGTLRTAAGHGVRGRMDRWTGCRALVVLWREMPAYRSTDPSRSALGQHLPCHPLLRRQNRASAATASQMRVVDRFKRRSTERWLTVDITERESRRSLADSLGRRWPIRVWWRWRRRSWTTPALPGSSLFRSIGCRSWPPGEPGFRQASTTSGSTTGWRPRPGAGHQLAICVSCLTFSELSRSSPSPVGRGPPADRYRQDGEPTRTAAASCCGG